jgi:hypothetical protein
MSLMMLAGSSQAATSAFTLTCCFTFSFVLEVAPFFINPSQPASDFSSAASSPLSLSGIEEN